MTHAVDLLRTLYDYSAWARNRLLDAAAGLTPEQQRAAIPGVYGSIHDTLVHMAASQWMWLERVQGSSPERMPGGADFADLDQLRTWWDEQQRASMVYLDSLTDDDLERTIHYTNTAGRAFSRRVWHALLQVTNHQTEHRSQVATMLTQLGVEAPATDLVVYLSQT